MDSASTQFILQMQHPVRFRLFLFSKLPSAYFAGIRIIEINESLCAVTVPFKWFTQNPFRSTYFACLSMAAEMSTGALSMAHLYKSDPAVSMLVTRVEGNFLKKATGITTFTCNDGKLIKQTIADAVTSGEPRIIRAASTGKNHKGEIIAEFFVTWSFKARTVKS